MCIPSDERPPDYPAVVLGFPLPAAVGEPGKMPAENLHCFFLQPGFLGPGAAFGLQELFGIFVSVHLLVGENRYVGENPQLVECSCF